MAANETFEHLRRLTPRARDRLRRALIVDQRERDGVAQRLLRYDDDNGRAWASLIDWLSLHPDARRRIVRLLGELEATDR